MHHARMTEIVHHPEYGPCVWGRSERDQKPLSWRHVAWRAPKPEGPLRVRNLIPGDELVRVAAIATLIRDRGCELVAADRLRHATLPRMRRDEPVTIPQRTLVREWRGTIDSRSDEIDVLPERCILTVQQRLGGLTFILATGFPRNPLVMIDTSLPAVMEKPVDALNHLYVVAERAIGMPRTMRRDLREENRAIGAVIATAACSIIPYRSDWSMAASLRSARSPIGESIYIAEDGAPEEVMYLAAGPMLDAEIRSMMTVDAEHRYVEHDGSIGIHLEGQPQVETKNIERPSPVEILRMVDRNGGEPPILRDPDSTDPGHPRSQWLMPVETARAFGMAA